MSRRIFSRIFSPEFFSSFLWEKVPRKILQENPRENPPNSIQQKSSNTFLQIGRGKNHLCGAFVTAICALTAEIHCHVGHDAGIIASAMPRCIELKALSTIRRTAKGSGKLMALVAHIAGRCDTIAAIPHVSRYRLREVSTPPKWCDAPSYYLVSHRHICAIPHFVNSRAIIVRYSVKTSMKEFCDSIVVETGSSYRPRKKNSFHQTPKRLKRDFLVSFCTENQTSISRFDPISYM